MTKITLSRQFANDGFTPNELARMSRAGELVHVRRGAYAEPSATELAPRIAHLQLLHGTAPLCSPDAVVSHISAAVLHDLPVWTDRLERVHLTRSRAAAAAPAASSRCTDPRWSPMTSCRSRASR